MRHCSHCNKPVEHPATADPVLCFRCYNHLHSKKATCAQCGKFDRTHGTNDEGNPICGKCYGVLFLTEICAKCGQERSVSFRTPDGSAFCASCYYNMRTPMECGRCRRLKPKHTTHKIYGGVCKTCYNKIRKQEDPYFALIDSLRARVRNAFNRFGRGKKIHSSKEYGIDYKAIVARIGACPGSRTDYHVDHVFPLAAFDFSRQDHIKAAFAPDNHQWLNSHDNLSKQSAYDPHEFQLYLASHGVLG